MRSLENDNRTDFSKDSTIVFAFDKVGDVIDACKAVKATYDHFSSLYFDESKKIYFLKMFTDGEPDANFRQNCISLLEYGNNVPSDKFFDSYLAMQTSDRTVSVFSSTATMFQATNSLTAILQSTRRFWQKKTQYKDSDKKGLYKIWQKNL